MVGALLSAPLARGGDKSGVKPTAISLPSGPGSIKGLGESFQPQLNSGTAAYSVKLEVPPGRAGFAPELALTYNSGIGNGVYGLGWDIPIPSLRRGTEKRLPLYADYPASDGVDNDTDGIGDNFEKLDIIAYSNGEEIVPVTGGYYRLKTEGEFTRFAREGAGWVANRRDGSTMHFGRSAASQVHDGAGRVFRWNLEDLIDTNGNTITFLYKALDTTNQTYLKEIDYNPSTSGGSMRVELSYELRPDVIEDYRPGFELRTAFRCRGVIMTAAGSIVRSYGLDYSETSDIQPLSLLSAVVQHGNDGTSSLPPATFTYTSFDPSAAVLQSIPAAPAIALGKDADLLDVNGDGLPDILDTSASTHVFYLNKGPDSHGTVQWDSRTAMAVSLGKHLSSPDVQLADLDGDGRADLLDKFSSTTNVYHLDDRFNWKLTGIFPSAGFNLNDPNVRLLDLNGDKRIDVLMTGGSQYVAWLSLPSGRWSQPHVFPSPNPQMKFDRPYVRLADMNADGLQDLVWLDSGICIYYPSLGYGRFGAPVTMMNAISAFDPAKLFLIDVNGDGLADIVNVAGLITVAINKGVDRSDASRGWLAPLSASFPVPFTNSTTSARQADMNGNGSIDIAFNTVLGGAAALAFVDFSPGEHPYQLKSMSNGIGRTTSLDYNSTTTEMLRDRAAGRPWPVGLPFPVQVVTRVKTRVGLDQNVYETRLAYHDGYYDAGEKEFRGFRFVDQTDVGDDSQGAPTLVTSYQFDVGRASEALKGKLLSTERRTAGGEVFDRESYFWESRQLLSGLAGDARVVTFPVQVKRIRDVIEEGRGPAVEIESAYDFDAYGNMTLQADYGRVEDVDKSGIAGDSPKDQGAGNDEQVVLRTYSASQPSGLAAWLLDALIEQETRDINGVPVARRRNYYDDETFSTATIGSITRGNLTMVLDWVDPKADGAFVTTIRRAYDSSGNVIRLDDPLFGSSPGHYREIAYDSAFSTFPVSETIYSANADTGGSTTLRLTATYDPRFGVVTTSTDFNRFESRYRYDAFGRLTAIVKPGDSESLPTLAYSYMLNQSVGHGSINWIETRQREVSGQDGTIDSRTFYDGLGRKVMTRAEGEDTGQTVVQDIKTFNVRSAVWKDYLPYFDSGDLSYREPTLNSVFIERTTDALGRPLLTYQPGGAGETERKFSRRTYLPLSETLEDEEQTIAGRHAGASKKLAYDGFPAEAGHGRLVEVTERVKLNDSGEVVSSPASWITRYTYDTLGELTGYVDAQRNEKHLLYDGLKRLVFSDDPDRGFQWFLYDPAGNLTRTRDAKGQEVAYRYDGVNRRVAESRCTTAESSSTGPSPYAAWQTSSPPPVRAPDVAYHYDFPKGPIQTGESFTRDAVLAAIQSGSTSSMYDLNHDGVVDLADLATATSRFTIPIETITAQNTLGMLAWISDPSGETHNSYDARARTNWVAYRIRRDDPADFVTVRTIEDHDAFDRVTRLTYPDRSFVDFTYNARGLPQSVTGAVTRRDYSAAGQLTRLDLACGVSSIYQYDHRLRLAHFTTQRTSDGTTLQDLSYGYDAVSNVVQILDGRSDAVLDKIGGELGLQSAEARPYRATAVYAYDDLNRLMSAANPAVFGSLSFGYDRIGNMVSSTGPLASQVPPVALGAMAYGGSTAGMPDSGAWNRVGRPLGAAPGPHAFTSSMPGASSAGLSASYDANGNVAKLGDITLSWDSRDWLQSAADPSQHKYSYDFDGERRRKVESVGVPGESLFIGPFSELRSGKLFNYVFAGANRVARAQSGTNPEVEFYLHDHSGSPVATLDGAARVRALSSFYPYGQVRLAATSAGPTNIYGYSGKEREVWGSNYFGARYYSSTLSRFLSVDPGNDFSQTDPSSGNPYFYTRNRPIASRDEDGRFVGLIVSAAFIAIDIHTIMKEGPTPWNVGMLVLDVALPAGGKLLSGAVKLAKAGEVVAHMADLERTTVTGVQFAGGGEGAFARYMREAHTLDISTATNTSVFYSGTGNRVLAEEFALANGKKTLELTTGGRWLDEQKLFGPNSPLPADQARQVWAIMSERFAAGSSGTAIGFVEGAPSSGLFNTVEHGTLLNNPNVVNIITGGH